MDFRSVLRVLKQENRLEILRSEITVEDEISEICLFENGAQNIRKKLYIGNIEEIISWIKAEADSPEKGAGLSAIIGIKERDFEDESFSRHLAYSLENGMISNYALIREEHTLKALQAVNNIVNNIMQKKLKTSYQVTELMALAMRGADLKSILKVSEKTLENPVIIIDAGFKILDVSSMEDIDDDIWKASIRRGYCSYEFIKEVHKIDQIRPFPHNSDVYEVNCSFSAYVKSCSKIFHKDRLVGYVIMLKKREIENALIEEYLPMVGSSVCEVLLRTKEHKGVFGSQEENLIHELIHGGDEELIKIRFKINQIELPEKMSCLMMKTNEYLNSIQATTFLKEQIKNILPGAFCLEEQGNLLVICRLSQDGRLTSEEERRLLGLFQQGVIHMGMSSPCTDIMALKDAYGQSAQLYKISKRLQIEKEIMYFSDYSFYIMLSNLNEKDLLQYAHPALNILRKYDQIHNGELYKTLQVLVDHQSQMVKTAEALSIHRNTLSYRINKIIELTGLDLSSNEDIFRLSYGFKVEKYCRVAV